MAGRVLGVDACKAGWVGVALDGGEVSAHFGSTIADLVSVVEAAGTVTVVAIDIPIGLPDASRRTADELARGEIGARWASVFVTPVRAALEAPDHASAVRLNRQSTLSETRATGEGVSQQAFRLRTKILEVDSWVRNQDRRIVEVHPELCFARMAGAPLNDRKVTWAGVERRRALLAAEGIPLIGDLGPVGRVARVDDVLDAAAAAWSARRVASGTAACLPRQPQIFSDGISCAIWA